MENLSKDQERLITYVLYGSAGLSLLGSSLIILTYIFIKSARTYGTKLIFYLCIADFFNSISWFPWNIDSPLCQVQAMFLQFFSVSSCLWSLSISISIFQVFFLENVLEEKEMHRSFVIYHSVNWGFPAITVIFCLAFHKFGKAGPWCWIESPNDYFRLLAYIPLILVSLFSVFSFIAIVIKMRTVRSDFKRSLTRRLSLYLLAFLTSQIPAVINRTQNFIHPNHQVFILFFLQALLQPAQGFANCIVYGITEPAIAEHYKLFFSKFRCCKCLRKSSRPTSLVTHPNNRRSTLFEYTSLSMIDHFHSLDDGHAPGAKESSRQSVHSDNVPVFSYDYHSDSEDDSQSNNDRDVIATDALANAFNSSLQNSSNSLLDS